jgi:hypothetical protein
MALADGAGHSQGFSLDRNRRPGRRRPSGPGELASCLQPLRFEGGGAAPLSVGHWRDTRRQGLAVIHNGRQRTGERKPLSSAPRPSGCATGHPSPPRTLGLAATDSFRRDRPTLTCATSLSLAASSHNDLTPLHGYRGLLASVFDLPWFVVGLEVWSWAGKGQWGAWAQGGLRRGPKTSPAPQGDKRP